MPAGVYAIIIPRRITMKRTLGLFIVLCVVGILILGCTSTVPFQYFNNENIPYVILGPVTYESSEHVGYTDLLNAAKGRYPDCDYVVDVMIDIKRFGILGYPISQTYYMRGTAVKYR
jgi:hypothetical protein